MVFLIHIPGTTKGIEFKSSAWYLFNIVHDLSRWTIPVLVMISGSLFLSRDIPIKVIYKKYVLRLVIAYFVWSFIYTFLYNYSFLNRMLVLIKGQYHLWFIPMIIGLYIIIPLIKPISDDNKKTRYFFILALIFTFFLPFISNITNDFLGAIPNSFDEVINKVIGNFNMRLVAGYSSYFILGHYLNKTNISKKTRIILYILGIIGFILTIVLNLFVSYKTTQTCTTYSAAFSINVLLSSIGIFTWFKYRKYDKKVLNKIILKLSKYSFGAYLAHIFIIKEMNKIIGLTVITNPFLYYFCLFSITAVSSFAISAFLNHIPVLKKYIV